MAAHQNLMAPDPTRLPDDHVDVAVYAKLAAGEAAPDVARAHPDSSAAWAQLAMDALAAGDEVLAYAAARTGYHRGLDALRRNGWRGAGPVPFAHAPNRGVLAAIAALAAAAKAFDDAPEAARCLDLLRDCDASAPAEFGLA